MLNLGPGRHVMLMLGVMAPSHADSVKPTPYGFTPTPYGFTLTSHLTSIH